MRYRELQQQGTTLKIKDGKRKKAEAGEWEADPETQAWNDTEYGWDLNTE